MNKNTNLGQDDMIDLLDSVTGLSWSPPPERPSFLYNGYHAEVLMIEAPYIVRLLQEAAISGTGRQRAIIFNAYGRGRAMINLPREVATTEGFQMALSRCKPSLRLNQPMSSINPIAYPATLQH